MAIGLLLGCSSGKGTPSRGGSFTGGLTNPVCTTGTSVGPVQAPVFVRNVKGQTGWFASPIVADLDKSGAKKIIAAYYTLYVYDASGNLLDSAAGNGSRIYAPHVVTDLEGDGTYEIIVGQGHQVFAYEWRPGVGLHQKWVADTTTAGEQPEVRGLAAADLDHDGYVEVVATTTQTQSAKDGGAQVFVFDHDGHPYQPPSTPSPPGPATITAPEVTPIATAPATTATGATGSTWASATSTTTTTSRSSSPTTTTRSRPSRRTARPSTPRPGSPTPTRRT